MARRSLDCSVVSDSPQCPFFHLSAQGAIASFDSPFLSRTHPGSRRINIPKMNIGHGERSGKKIDQGERIRPSVCLHGNVPMADRDANLCQTREEQEYAIDEQRLGLSDELVGRLMGCHRTWK